MNDDLERMGLSATELEALREEIDEDTLSAGADDEDDDDDDGDDPGESGAGDTEPEADDDAGEVEAPPQGSDNPALSLPSPDAQAIAGRIDSLQATLDKLEADYDEGNSELSYAEHRAKVRELGKELMAASAELAEAKTVARLNAAYEQQWWTREIASFKRDAKREGVDYDGDKKLEAEWDKAVRFLGADPGNADKDAAWFLREAHEMVKARFRIGQAPTSTKSSKVEQAIAARRVKGPFPPTLSGLPEAGREDEGQSEFSHLDKLSGMDIERAIAKMSPEQAERWLRS